MRCHIETTVYDVNDKNCGEMCIRIGQEIMQYQSYKIGRRNLNVCPICLDTETTTIEIDSHRYAFGWMYQLQVGKFTFLSRKKCYMLEMLRSIDVACVYQRTNVYLAIANLKYEWSFLCKDLQDLIEDTTAQTDILFAMVEPLAVVIGRITICDIVRMSNMSLAKIGKEFCVTQKLKGDLDYDKIRNSQTPITPAERMYCINDVVVGAEYMAFMHDTYTKQGERMPFTATGFIRHSIEQNAYQIDPETGQLKNQDILNEILAGHPTLYADYERMINYLYRGGYTHGNCYYCGEVLADIEHIDYTSDYPACLLQHKYPYRFCKEGDQLQYGNCTITVSKYKSERALDLLQRYEHDLAFYCTATFDNIRSITPHSLESKHKLIKAGDDIDIDNGRVIRADTITVMITEQDYLCYKQMYQWDNMIVDDLHIGIKKQLPDYVVSAIVEAYVDKKRLKDQGKPYAVEKIKVNSCYGCMCQRIPITDQRDIITDADITHIDSPVPFRYLNVDNPKNIKYFNFIKQKLISLYHYQPSEKLNKAILKVYDDIYNGVAPKLDNKNYRNIYDIVVNKLQQRAYMEHVRGKKIGNHMYKSKMLSPWWGIWCTAYARRRLVDMIAQLEFLNNDRPDICPEPLVVYYDTDSLFINAHQSEACWRAVKTVIDNYNQRTTQLNIDTLRIYDDKGRLDDLGLFTWESPAKYFKQLGAKRYLQALVKHYKKCSVTRHGHGSHCMIKHTTSAKLHIEPRYVTEATIAGLSKADFNNKINAQNWTLQQKFDFFNHGMVFDLFETSKKIPVYNSKPYSAEVLDDYGNIEIMSERCGQTLEDTTFTMMITGLLLQQMSKRIG